jgi:prepilin-type N-terminal cleavage/methylation domain-containing protein
MIKKIQALRAKKGFTLVELIVVIAIIGILAAILVPMMLNYVSDARFQASEAGAKSVQTAYSAAIATAVAAGEGVNTGTETFTFSGTTWTPAGANSSVNDRVVKNLATPKSTAAVALVLVGENAGGTPEVQNVAYAEGTTAISDFSKDLKSTKGSGGVYVGTLKGRGTNASD